MKKALLMTTPGTRTLGGSTVTLGPLTAQPVKPDIITTATTKAE